MAFASRRTSRGCIVALGILLLGMAAAAFLVRRALEPDRLRTFAEARLSGVIGQPVTIGTMDVSLLPTPSVEARDIHVGGPTRQAPPSVTLRAVRITPRLSSLFSTPRVIERVELIGLTIDALRGADGRWVLPFKGFPAPTAAARSPGEPGSIGESAAGITVNEISLADGRLTVTDEAMRSTPGAPRAASLHAIAATARTAGDRTRLDELSAALGGSSLTGSGGIGPEGLRLSLIWTTLRPADLPEVFHLAGVEAPVDLSIEGEKPLTLDVTVDPVGAISATGALAAARASFGTLSLTRLASPLRFAGNQLSLDPLTFTAYGGTQRGRLTVNAATTPSSWTIDTLFEGVDMREFVNANSSAKNMLSGTGRLQGRVAGPIGEPIVDRAAGTIAVAVADGALHDFPLLAAVNAALKIGAGDVRDLRFERLTATLAIAGGSATTNDFLATSGELTLRAQGTLGFDQSLRFGGSLAFSKSKSDELTRSVKELSALKNERGEIEVPLTVSGTVTVPRFSVDVRGLLGRAAEKELKRQLERALKRIIK